MSVFEPVGRWFCRRGWHSWWEGHCLKCGAHHPEYDAEFKRCAERFRDR